MKWRFVASITVIAVWIVWLLLIITYASVDSNISNNDLFTLTQSGQFGDSFGVIASLMATLAASAAFFTYFSQKEQQSAQEFEQNFYSLLNNLQITLSQIDVTRRLKSKDTKVPEDLRIAFGEIIARHEGREAIRILHKILKISIRLSDYADTKCVFRKYCNFYDKWHDDLGHYFRMVYKILRLIDERSGERRSYYARILRAHLSNAEQCLIAYNCICGEGRFEFKNLVAKYALLHNLHRTGLDEKSEAELKFFVRKLPLSSFRFDENKNLSYDD